VSCEHISSFKMHFNTFLLVWMCFSANRPMMAGKEDPSRIYDDARSTNFTAEDRTGKNGSPTFSTSSSNVTRDSCKPAARKKKVKDLLSAFEPQQGSRSNSNSAGLAYQQAGGSIGIADIKGRSDGSYSAVSRVNRDSGDIEGFSVVQRKQEKDASCGDDRKEGNDEFFDSYEEQVSSESKPELTANVEESEDRENCKIPENSAIEIEEDFYDCVVGDNSSSKEKEEGFEVVVPKKKQSEHKSRLGSSDESTRHHESDGKQLLRELSNEVNYRWTRKDAKKKSRALKRPSTVGESLLYVFVFITAGNFLQTSFVLKSLFDTWHYLINS